MIYLDDVLGNADTKQRLGQALQSGTLPHAVMITGPYGSGKRTLATSVAMALCCNERSNKLPCGECIVCRRIRAREHTDVKYLSLKAGKATVGVEEVRLLREDMFLSPSEADAKIYIIEDADALTPQSQNALLKVLEEPPHAVYIILIATSGDKILSTIKSRVHLISMELFSREQVSEHLKRLTERQSEESIFLASLSSGGRLGVALESLSEDKQRERAQINACVKAFIDALPSRAPFSALYTALLDFPQKREELRQTLEVALDAARDLLALKLTDGSVELRFYGSPDEIDSSLRSISARRITAVCDVLLDAIGDLDKNVITSTLITDLSVRIKKTQ